MRRYLIGFFIIASVNSFAQKSFKERQKISNSVLFTVETHDGKKYVTNDALFHHHEITRAGWLKVEEKYKKMGVTTMMYFKLPADVQAITWRRFLKQKGIVIYKNDTIFADAGSPIGTLYEPILSPVYVRGVKRQGHRVYIVYNRKLNRKPSWETQKTLDSIREARRRTAVNGSRQRTGKSNVRPHKR